jgi:hypothetical protein
LAGSTLIRAVYFRTGNRRELAGSTLTMAVFVAGEENLVTHNDKFIHHFRPGDNS